jgi:carboxyl-terminal processing protease
MPFRVTSSSGPRRFASFAAWAAISLSLQLGWLDAASAQDANPLDAAAAFGQSGEQPALDSAEATPASPLAVILAKGDRLERQRRWGDALSHYEEALRHYPDDRALAEREDVARLHWSLERRSTDRSYLESVRSLSTDQSAGLYLELLRKINAHYVTNPPWARLAERGARALDLALTDDAFLNACGLANASGDQLLAARQALSNCLSQRAVQSPEQLTAMAREAAGLVEANCGLRSTASVLEFVTAAAGGLDEYSAYLTSDQLRDVYSQIEGNFVGLGVELKADAGTLLIVHVIPGSPAERAGIRDGDRIVADDGRETAEMSTDEAASLLTGPEGSYVQVSALTPGGQPRSLSVRREHVEVPSLEGVKIIDPKNGVAYVKIPAFQKTTSRDLDKTLWDLHRQGMRSLLLDLRGNPGGLLTAAVEVADKFLQQGVIVSTRGRNSQEDFVYQAHYGGTWRVPLAVLIDRDSASASEIFAGAIKDNHRGIVVGERSYGKGSVQGIFPLGYGGAGVRLTTALFYSPLDHKISHVGVSPDREVRTAARASFDGASHLAVIGHDPVLEAGIEAALDAAKARVATPSGGDQSRVR